MADADTDELLRGLAAQVEELRLRLSRMGELEREVARLRDELEQERAVAQDAEDTPGAPAGGVVSRTEPFDDTPSIPPPTIAAFHVYWDMAAEELKVYAPPGCLFYHEDEVTIDGADDDDAVSLGDRSGTVWCHVTGEKGDYRATFDWDEDADGVFSFKVATVPDSGYEPFGGEQIASGTLAIGGEGGGEGKDVVGSEYIDVDDDEDAEGNVSRKVSAKIITSDPNPSEPTEHALLTHDTNQLVRNCSKTFLGNSPRANSDRVIIDGSAATISTAQAGNGTKTIEIAAGTGVETLSTGGNDSRKIELDPAKLDEDDVNKTITVRKLTFIKGSGDTDPTTVQILGSKDATIDLGNGKLIESTSVTASADPGGQNKLVFNYTDGSSDTFIIMNGLDGAQGSPGSPGSTPTITSTKSGSHTYVYSDGVLIADLADGNSPQITASKSGGVTTIYADGKAIATINDGAGSDGDYVKSLDSLEFSENGGKLEATLNYTKGDGTAGVCKGTVGNAEMVVVRSMYDVGGNRKFINYRKKAVVLGDSESSSDVFTATPHSAE